MNSRSEIRRLAVQSPDKFVEEIERLRKQVSDITSMWTEACGDIKTAMEALEHIIARNHRKHGTVDAGRINTYRLKDAVRVAKRALAKIREGRK